MTGRVTDGKAALSWAKFGKPWALASPKGGDFSKSLTLVTAKFTYQGKPAQWAATVASGVVGSDAEFRYSGPVTLPAAAQSYINNVIPKEYFPGSFPTVQRSHQVTVGGHPGWMVQFAVNYHLQGLDATKDTDVVVVVDTGKSVPSVFVVAIPNDANNLLPDITAELNSLRVSG